MFRIASIDKMYIRMASFEFHKLADLALCFARNSNTTYFTCAREVTKNLKLRIVANLVTLFKRLDLI